MVYFFHLKSQLMRIVHEWIKLYKGEKTNNNSNKQQQQIRSITAESALFVCNKWDEVERQANENEERNLQTLIVSKLKDKITDLDEETQVIRMSVSSAAQAQKKFDVINDDLNNLINGIQRLLPLCAKRKTQLFYS